VRARFLAQAGLSEPGEDVEVSFRRRDATLKGATSHDEIVLWFEHDLYDQLQLLQLLSWFAEAATWSGSLSLISIDVFPGHPTFHGLGELSPPELASLFPSRHTVSQAELALGRDAWAAFRSPNPEAIERIISANGSALPFLSAALRRHLEEFPSTRDGLSRTQRELLEVLTDGVSTPHAIFRAWQAREGAAFMGDTLLWWHLKRLDEGSQPLVATADGQAFRMPHDMPGPDAFAAQRFALTPMGRAVLAGSVGALAAGGSDRWLGGVHLHAGGPLWRWDAQGQVLISY
jgi:hypothetical protein